MDVLDTLIDARIAKPGSPIAGQALVFDGSNWVAQYNGVYARVSSAVDIVSSIAETDLFSVNVLENILSTNRTLRATLWGDLLHNNLAADLLTLRVKFGGTTYLADVTNFGGAVGALRQPWRLVVELSNLGVPNSQMVTAHWSVVVANAAAPTSGIGDINSTTTPSSLLGLSVMANKDTTAAQTLAVSGQWDTNSANDSFRMRNALVELI